MLLTKEQLSSVISKHAERENGLQDLMEIMLESMMLSERREYLNEYPGNKGNGFRQGRSYGQGRVLEFRIQRFLPCYETRKTNVSVWPAVFTVVV
jgi:hypothetical protein